MSTAAARPQIWLAVPERSGGWAPVTAMAHLMAGLLEAELTVFTPRRMYSRGTRAASLLPRMRGERGPLLIIAAHPGMLLSLIRPRYLLGRHRAVGAWIIDSFWDELLPRFARTTANLDRLWIADAELVDSYGERTGSAVSWAPWGADVLGRFGTASAERPVDLLRLGRQPGAWNDDERNAAWARATGLRYQGRFPAPEDPLANHRTVLEQLERAKIVLSSTNLADSSDYTHPTREYVTARFTDAAASGTLIAGRFPQVRALEVIPEQARLPIDVGSRAAGEHAIRDAAAAWTPGAAEAIQRAALQVTDWRWRFREIADGLGIDAPRLDADLTRIAAIGEEQLPPTVR